MPPDVSLSLSLLEVGIVEEVVETGISVEQFGIYPHGFDTHNQSRDVVRFPMYVFCVSYSA